MRLYIASPFFNKKQVSNYHKVLAILNSKEIEYFAPMLSEIEKNDRTKKEWANETFSRDIKEIKNCDAVLMLFYGLYSDSGTAWECGYAFALNKPVIVVHLHKSKSNCMVNCGSYSHIIGLKQLRNYNFNKMQKIDYYDIKTNDDTIKEALSNFKSILYSVYDRDTVYPELKEQWSKNNPTFGQCVPTALLVQHYFGGEIFKHNKEQHYFNIINGKIVDLTKGQFDYELDYTDSFKKQPDLSKANTKERYDLLKRRVENYKK